MSNMWLWDEVRNQVRGSLMERAIAEAGFPAKHPLSNDSGEREDNVDAMALAIHEAMAQLGELTKFNMAWRKAVADD